MNSGAGFAPNVPGTYRWVATFNGDANNAPISGTCGDLTEQTIVQAQPAITTNASGGFVIGAPGQTLTDTAQVTGLVAPVTGTVTFTLYAPGDTDCNGTPVTTRSGRPLTVVNGTGTADSGAGVIPAGPGTYRWRAVFIGDVNNNTISGPCNAPGENTIVQSQPAIATNASSGFIFGAPGQTLTDTATVTGLVAPVTGTVTFTLYAPGDTDCNGTPVDTRSGRPLNVVAGTGTADSGAGITPAGPGTYRWRAVFIGDVNNNTISGPCNAPGENTIVQSQPAIATNASSGFIFGAPGQTLTDTATVTGLVAPVTGTVTFTLYAPGDTDCNGTPVDDALGPSAECGGRYRYGGFGGRDHARGPRHVSLARGLHRRRQQQHDQWPV